jgi:hypothetical protein
MRLPRLKIDTRNTFYHTYNRVAGVPGHFPFAHVEKEHFVYLLRRLQTLYTVDVIGYTVMGNHFHLILHAPEQTPSPEETCARYNAFYNGTRTLYPGTPECERIARRLRDISCFMRDLQQDFATWFNHTRPVRRRGTLWAGRFKHTILEDGLAVWDCWKYIAMNPLRAGLTLDPADYRFSDYGAWAGRGRHPFEGNVERHLLPSFRGLLHTGDLAALKGRLREEVARVRAREAKLAPAGIEAAIEQAGRPIDFRTDAGRRMRYWVDGLVIGSERFVRQVMTRARGEAHMHRRRLAQAVDMAAGDLRLVSYRRLRVLL